MGAISDMLRRPFFPYKISTRVNGQCIPADRRGSVFLLALRRHNVVCIVVELLSAPGDARL